MLLYRRTLIAAMPTGNQHLTDLKHLTTTTASVTLPNIFPVADFAVHWTFLYFASFLF
jgi:hypothetical protein